ncbi:MAG: hypothetical protein AAF587_36915 [Bacteroidota bacterium]
MPPPLPRSKNYWVYIFRRDWKFRKDEENCQGTTHGIQQIDQWLGETKWDLIHFNFGLHHLKHVEPETGKNSKKQEYPRQAEPKQYKKNLKAITEKLVATQARLIFATTTPFPDQVDGPLREYGDVEHYNSIAFEDHEAAQDRNQ